uniref:Uncharacterized protein n=1 Tax=Anopheles atroparvus TaxID=41427 RepID=A0A182JJT7_ANOAO
MDSFDRNQLQSFTRPFTAGGGHICGGVTIVLLLSLTGGIRDKTPNLVHFAVARTLPSIRGRPVHWYAYGLGGLFMAPTTDDGAGAAEDTRTTVTVAEAIQGIFAGESRGHERVLFMEIDGKMAMVTLITWNANTM